MNKEQWKERNAAYIDSMKDMRNEAAKTKNEAKDVYQNMLGTALVATMDAVLDEYKRIFKISDAEIPPIRYDPKEPIQ